MFDTRTSVVRRVVNSKTMQEHMSNTLGDVSDLDALAARRLLEALLEEAFDEEQSKGRTEARKILARHYLPKRLETKSEHRHFIEVPAKSDSTQEWAERYGTRQIEPSEQEVIEAEVIEDDDE